MEIGKIKKLIALLEQSSLSELEIKEGEESVRLARYLSPPMAASTPVAFSPPALISDGASSVPTHPIEDGLISIDAPMVGTLYRAPQPGAEPFVREGQTIHKGQILFIIEAMKMFNQIEAEHSGTIHKILIEDGQPVEFGQALILLKADA